MEHPVVLYDGVCGFCNQSVQFVLRHDDKKVFRFASLQSSYGLRILAEYGIDASPLNTVYVFRSADEGQVLLQRSEAILFLMNRLGGVWSVLAKIASLLPCGIRDWVYNFIANHRYQIFGRYNTCPLPRAADRQRFLDM